MIVHLSEEATWVDLRRLVNSVVQLLHLVFQSGDTDTRRCKPRFHCSAKSGEDSLLLLFLAEA